MQSHALTKAERLLGVGWGWGHVHGTQHLVLCHIPPALKFAASVTVLHMQLMHLIYDCVVVGKLLFFQSPRYSTCLHSMKVMRA